MLPAFLFSQWVRDNGKASRSPTGIRKLRSWKCMSWQSERILPVSIFSEMLAGFILFGIMIYYIIIMLFALVVIVTI